jgi:TolB-like protein/DNA-binding winged helix-turn-helix (wHTH) protein
VNLQQTPATAPTPDLYRLEDLLIDARARRVTRGGMDLGVTGRSFDLLFALLRAAPGLVSFDELLDTVWPGTVVGVETVTQRVKLLRQALGDDAERPRYILAVRGHGYRLATQPIPASGALGPSSAAAADTVVVPVAAQTQLAAPTSHAADADAHSEGRFQGSRWRWWAAVGLVVVALAAGVVWWGQRQPPQVTALSPAAPAATPHTPDAAGSIAVMPFANLTGDASKEYVADGMSEELIDALGRVPGLRIPARTSTFAYKGGTTDIRRVAKDLNVATVLEGSVRAASERLQVNVRLIDSRSGFQIWEHNYERRLTDLFKLQDELATEIVAAMRGYLKTDLAAPAARQPPSQDFEAYDLYLQSRATGHGTAPSERLALDLVNQAIARDPDFAQALAYRSFLEAGNVGMISSPAETLQSARRDAARALALNPNLAEALTATAIIQAVQGQWLNAEHGFRTAVAADPLDTYARNLYVLFVAKPAGHLQIARARLQDSYRLAPADGFTVSELMLTSSLLGLDQDVAKYAQLWQTVGDRPLKWDLLIASARTAARGGHYAEASQQASDALPKSLAQAGGTEAVKMAYSALADPSLRSAAVRSLERLRPRLLAGDVDARTKGFFLSALVMLGGFDSAYALADQLLDSRPTTRWNADWSDLWLPEMRPFRHDPRFQRLVERLGLIDYWRQYGPPDECDLHNGTLTCH